MTKYVKLIAKPDTWFKAGTEAFDYDEYGKRITLESYNKWLKSGSILARGIHIYEDGVEAEDGELCGIDEFDVELVEEERLIQTNQVDVMIEMAKDSDKLESENFIEKVNNADMSKTPRTDAVWERFRTDTTGELEPDVEFSTLARGLEEELNNALEKINRLKKAGDVMYALLNPPSISMRTTEYDNALQGWDDAKIS